MKIKGKKIEGANIEVIPIPRGDGVPDVIFKAQAILDYESFNKLCPIPIPPTIVKPGGIKILNVEDPVYRQDLTLHSQKRMDWTVVESLRATEGLEWETVQMEDSSTWCNYKTELKAAGFCEIEVVRIVTGVYVANAVSQEKVEEARERFYLGEAAKRVTISSLPDEPLSTQSGVPVND